MKIDILSDTHFDSHFKYMHPTKDIVHEFWKIFKPEGEVLIVAGDIGHYNMQNANIFKHLLDLYYKKIIFVLGNHDYYVLNNVIQHFHDGKFNLQYKDSFTRVQEAISMYGEIENLHLLDGNIVEFEGIKFGGSMGWYDGSYWKKYIKQINFNDIESYMKRVNTQFLWQNSLNDSLYIKPKIKYNAFLNKELEKINKALDQNPDIMITHICPSNLIQHQNPSYIKYSSTSFFNYDGKEHLKKFQTAIATHQQEECLQVANKSSQEAYTQQINKMKYWIFGHSHFNADFNIDSNLKLLSNCLGYKSERYNKILTIEI